MLEFLNLEIKKLSFIGKKYKNIKGKIKEEINGIAKMLQIITSKIDKKKYENFIKKYKIKVKSNEISDYLKNLVDFIMPKRNNLINYSDSEEIEEGEENKEESEDPFDRCKKFKEKESELRKNIKELFEKDQKFIRYISFYLSGKLGTFIEENEDKFKGKLNSLKKKLNEKYLLYLKLNQIHKIIATFKLYRFDIKNDFDAYVLNNQEFIPNKKKKIENGKEVILDITNFDYFIKRTKEYLGNINDKVELLGEEPNQFIFNLFLEKIGLNWS